MYVYACAVDSCLNTFLRNHYKITQNVKMVKVSLTKFMKAISNVKSFTLHLVALKYPVLLN